MGLAIDIADGHGFISNDDFTVGEKQGNARSKALTNSTLVRR